MVDSLGKHAKINSDHLRATANNKVWQAPWCRRLADVARRLQKSLCNSNSKEGMTKHYLKTCKTLKPKSRGIAFLDKCLDENWNEVEPCRENDCYQRVGYKLHVTEADVVKEG